MSTIRHSFLFALEWRCIAYVLTIGYFWLTGLPVWEAIAHGSWLQLWLFTGQVVWLRYRRPF